MRIHLTFVNGGVSWQSEGWGHDAKAMAKAKRAINKGENPAEVVKLLEKAGFEVHTQTAH